MRAAFADTHYFFAFANEHDASHQKAVDFTRNFTGTLFTTEWVLTEVADGWCRGHRRSHFAILWNEVRLNPNIQLVRFSADLFEAGIELYINRPDKEWSLTDCISFVVMQREGLREALTADRHFEQAGFVALLK